MIEIVVCDDDKNDLDNAVNMLHKILENQDKNYKIRAFLSANELLRSRQKIDIGILDIAMDEVNGIRLGRKLKEKFPSIKLIYTTSYEEYCIQAINEVHAFSFLCKPLDNEKLKV